MDIGNFMSASEYNQNDENLLIKYLTFLIDDNLFAVPISDVVSILGMQNGKIEITSVPEFPSYAKGVINVRGAIIPVIDVRLRLRKPKKEYGSSTCIIIVTVNEQQVGFIVDSVSEVTDVPYNMISAPPQGFVKDDVNSYLIGVAEQDDKVILIIDSEKIVYEKDKNVIFSED